MKYGWPRALPNLARGAPCLEPVRASQYTPPTAAKSMPPNRLSLRLGQLPHDVLAELAAQLCSDSPALQAAADKCIAAHKPLPPWAVERVLLSPDLMPHILGPLVAEDGSAAAVCSQWLAGWKATNEPRRRLKQVPLDLPKELGTPYANLQMAGTPDGRLVVRAGSEVHILDSSMHVLQTLTGAEYGGLIAASDDSFFDCRSDGEALRRSSYDGTVHAEYQLEGYSFYCPVLAPGGLLFCVICENSEGENDVEPDAIIAVDAQTLQLRHRFGLGLLDDAHQLAVVGDELYVCDTNNNRLQVFSLTGEHRRSVMGEWRSPKYLCFAKDRLYLVERDPTEDPDGDDVDADSLQGRRILVLSLQGEILQVVTHPTLPMADFNWLCCFDDKLLAPYHYCVEDAGNIFRVPTHGMLALQGL